MSSQNWTEEQREALKRWSSKDSSERHPHDLLPGGRKSERKNENKNSGSGANDVQPDQCEDMRTMFKDDDDMTIKEMAESHFEFHRSTIAEHVFGRRCSHDIDEEPAESPMGNIDSGDFIQADECAEMRNRWADVGEIVEVQKHFEKTYGQTYHHLVGRCKCDHDVPNIRNIKEAQ